VLMHSQGLREGAPLPRAVLAGRPLRVDVLPDLYRVHVDAAVTPATPLELSGLEGLPADAPGCRVQATFVRPGT
jgi:hypothetical protein